MRKTLYVIPHNQEAEDLYHEAITRLSARLNEAKAHPERNAIKDFRSYITRFIANACNDYLCAKSPARSRLFDGFAGSDA